MSDDGQLNDLLMRYEQFKKRGEKPPSLMSSVRSAQNSPRNSGAAFGRSSSLTSFSETMERVMS